MSPPRKERAFFLATRGAGTFVTWVTSPTSRGDRYLSHSSRHTQNLSP